MAYINVAEWTPDQVTDWLKGLDDTMFNYVSSFTNNEVGGKRLLNIRAYELEQLGMHALGHQEIVLEAVENLRNFHYNLDKENLQFMAMHLATAARSLKRKLACGTNCDESKLETQILSDITYTIGTIKPLINWLDRAPFRGQRQFTEICRNLLRLGLEMATIAQRDRFVERPVEQIRVTAETLDRLANYIIQDISDPMLLQPASLNLITLKKRESDLGFNIVPSYCGIHRVTDIKYNSPAHNSGKIEDGDEIVQINYQTIVGWQYKTVLLQLHESLPDVLLTLKKRPKHTKVYGQIYMQPYRLPSKKRAIGTKWGDNFASSRTGFLTVQDNDFNLPLALKSETKKPVVATCSSDTDSSCSDILTPTDNKTSEKEMRMYYPKPRAVLQRRYTICGDQPHTMKNLTGYSFFNDSKPSSLGIPPSPNLRDKSVSFGFGLEVSPRPTTCIGIGAEGTLFSDKRKQTRDQEAVNKSIKRNKDEKSNPGISKVVRFEGKVNRESYQRNELFTCNVEDTILETFEPIPFADEDDVETLEHLPDTKTNTENETITELPKKTPENTTLLVEAFNTSLLARRCKLDIRSNSTPTYDQSGEDSDTPPAIEPRKEFLIRIPPVPPPRPRKQTDMANVVPVPPPKPLNMQKYQISPSAPDATDDSSTIKSFSSPEKRTKQLEDVNELLMPYKTKTLTLKKKQSLVSRRRNINLKVLGIGDIQGHLYRRTKDRRGVTFWARYYFVMVDTILYGFRSKDSAKASFVIYLPGFTVSIAKEVHSKPFAFKVYHSAKTFYFAAESQAALNQWFEFICQATLYRGTVGVVTDFNATEIEGSTKDLFSETDASDDENDHLIATNIDLSAQGNKPPTSKSATTPVLPPKSDKRYLGSLRKLTKGSLPFKGSSSSEKKAQSDIPVPTDQYRSYRKVPGGSFGIQIGPNTPGYHERPQDLFVSKNINNQLTTKNKTTSPSTLSASSNSYLSSNYEPNSASSPSLAATELLPKIISDGLSSPNDESPSNSSASSIKKKPHNYLHASNPNLLEIDFQISKTLDFSLPKINPANSWDAHQNIQGFVTLKDLMLQKQKEEAQEMYNNRVLLGVEKNYERKRLMEFQSEYNSRTQFSTEKITGKISKTQFRSLPKTPDYDISFKPDDEDIKRTRTKEGLKLRDFGYELITGDDPTGTESIRSLRQNSNISVNSSDHFGETNLSTINKTRSFLKSQPFLLYTHKNKKSDSCTTSSEKRFGSIKKKSKVDNAKSSSEQLFVNNQQSSGVTMTLPYNKKANIGFDTSGNNSGRIKKSHTYNNDLKDKSTASARYDTHRKNSMPLPIFSKFSLSSNATTPKHLTNEDDAKEKKLLGSPILHRTMFGDNHNYQTSSINNNLFCREREYDQEIFLQVVFPNFSKNTAQGAGGKHCRSSSKDNIVPPNLVAPPPPVANCDISQNIGIFSKSEIISTKSTLPEYPDMKCPPVFEPEFYSLTDANTSLNLQIQPNAVDKEGNERGNI